MLLPAAEWTAADAGDCRCFIVIRVVVARRTEGSYPWWILLLVASISMRHYFASSPVHVRGSNKKDTDSQRDDTLVRRARQGGQRQKERGEVPI
mmetsp:Transcript_3743/g.9545  ORF Transcript_3743/g.9545 Transcript_3743/m.9545 type:complete len:94 (-) Transcript_3743:22-303(-)